MTPELAARIQRLELTVFGRVEGLLQGDHRGLLPGPGGEAGDARPYVIGDDVRRIDWNVTARSQVPHVRDTTADHELETTLVVDVSGSMSFGTARAEKRELALGAAAVFAFLTNRGGNRVGAALVGPEVRWIPPQPGRPHVYRVLGELGRAGHRGDADLGRALRQVAQRRSRRGLVVVISDFIGAGSWERPLRALSSRHDVVGVEVADPREHELPAAGVMLLEDAETGRQSWVDTADARFRRDYRWAAELRAAEVAAAMRRAGATHLRLTTDRDWVADLVRSVVSRRRMRAAAGGTA